ncbi:transferase family-domain-containing protein [Xylaria cf. heliscus]|nr:transferase family-domain-containing protein [Xylaria cf. heliscus]
MTELSTSKQLSLGPLDLLMPRTYISVLFTFRTDAPSPSIIEDLQGGLDNLSKTVPWLSGQVFPTTTSTKPGLEIRYHANAPGPKLLDKGAIGASYETLSASGLQPDTIPDTIWPVPAMITEDLFASGVPVFGASVFRFADGKGVGVCVSAHHNAVDATGFAALVRLWGQHVAGSPLPSSSSSSSAEDMYTYSRARLAAAAALDLKALSSATVKDLFEAHPEYASAPPALPAEFPACACKLFAVPVARIEARRQRLKKTHASAPPSTNTLVCALVWACITRARRRRGAGHESSRLAMAVDGRRRLGDGFSGSPYLGNAVLYSLATCPASELDSVAESPEAFAAVCDAVAQSQAPAKIDARHVAEVCALVERAGDYRGVFVGWDLFGSRDLTVTSWADLDLYGTVFGGGLGTPEFVRIPSSAADGVGIVMPRKRGVTPKDEVVEVMVMLRSDDMALLEQDAMWKDFTA